MESEKYGPDENHFLTIEIEYKDSILLSEFKEALEGWNNQYNKYISHLSDEDNDDKLLIKEIKQGSIIIDLVSSMSPLLADYNNIITFFVSVKSMFDWLVTKIGNKPRMEIDDLVNTKKIIAPINHEGRQTNIFITGGNYAPIIIDSGNAKTISNNADEELAILIKPEDIIESDNDVKDVILKLEQLKNDEMNNKNTKGIIEEIDKKSYPVLFASGIKYKILHENDNPFLKNYLVNIKINKINGITTSYTVLDLLDSYIENEGQDETNLFS
jgi:hypothetical protein